jgi:pantetheine-phosphate adenylyltransferase
LDIIKRASGVFDKIVITVLENNAKSAMFSVSERVDMLKLVTADSKNVEVASFSGLLVKFAEQINADYIIKGLRAVSDFDFEFQMAIANRDLNNKIETLLLPASKEYMFLSSSIVKEVGKLGGDFENLIPAQIIDIVKEKLRGMS